MSHHYASSIKSLFLAPVVLTLASCSEDVKVTVKKVNSEIVINFGIKKLFEKKLSPVCLRRIEVLTKGKKELVLKTITREKKCTKVSSVTLGQKLPLFVEQINRLPLPEGEKYVVSIFADEGVARSEEWSALR